jgi:lipopolysaccharide export system permease protein
MVHSGRAVKPELAAGWLPILILTHLACPTTLPPPMRIFTRYLLSQLLKLFLLALTALTALFLIGGVVNEAMKQNLPLTAVLRLLPYLVPEVLRVTVPVCLLLATTSLYSRMAGSNEVVAVKALGISPLALLWPTFIVGFLLSLVTVWLNDLVSWGRNGVQRVAVGAAEEIVYAMLETQRGYASPNNSFSINVKGMDGRRLLSPMLTVRGHGNAPALTITAQEAYLHCDHEENVLKIALRNGTVDAEGVGKYDFPDVQEQEMPLEDSSHRNTETQLPSWLSLSEIPRETSRQIQVIEQTGKRHTLEAAFQLLCGDFDELTGKQWEGYETMTGYEQSRLYRLYAEPHRRWSAGFSCLCFVWVGAPVGIWLRNRDFLTSFFLCFLPILIVYYPLLIFTVDAAKSGSFPASLAWLGNICLMAAGTLILRKVIRY